MNKIFLLAAAAAALLSCQTNEAPKVAAESTVNMEAAKTTIDAANVKMSNAMVAGDSAAITAMYHSKAEIFPANMPMISGGAGMGSMVKEFPKMGVKNMELKTSELLNEGDALVETGTWKMSDGAKTLDNGKYLVVWKQENGAWKLFRDIWNSDNPPQAAH